MKKQQLIEKTALFIRKHSEQESSGHDWWHVSRVWKLAKKIAMQENANLFFVEMASLLHDLDDWKLVAPENTNNKAEIWMKELGMEQPDIFRITNIINEVSYKGAGVDTTPTTNEARIVQDADRLDAMGAIGIARTFAYGGYKDRLIYDPEVKPEMHQNFESYKKTTAPTINHFYEKLLLLKNRMNTDSAKKMANERHRFMELYLEQFYNEWNLN